MVASGLHYVANAPATLIVLIRVSLGKHLEAKVLLLEVVAVAQVVDCLAGMHAITANPVADIRQANVRPTFVMVCALPFPT